MKLLFFSLAIVGALALPKQTKFVDVRPKVPVNKDTPIPGPPTGKIVGGDDAEATVDYHQFPHAAQILFPPYENYPNLLAFCTGQIIGESYIMTAGHCCDDPKAELYTVAVGAAYLKTTDAPEDANSRTVIEGVKRVIQHENYNRQNISNDICLLELNEPLVWQKDLIQPIILATDDVAVADDVGTVVTMAGWGLTSDGPSAVQADLIQWTTDPILSDAECKAIFDIEFDAGEICIDTKDTHRGTCSGDSGGPLMISNDDYDPNYDVNAPGNSAADPKAIRWITVGITSYGASAGCALGFPDAFTDVNFYNGGTSAGQTGDNWIFDHSGIGGQ